MSKPRLDDSILDNIPEEIINQDKKDLPDSQNVAGYTDTEGNQVTFDLLSDVEVNDIIDGLNRAIKGVEAMVNSQGRMRNNYTIDVAGNYVNLAIHVTKKEVSDD